MCSRMMDFLLYCGISRDDFNSIRNQLWKRNTRAVHIAVMLAGGLEGWFAVREHWIERILFIAAALLLLYPGAVTDIAGLCASAILIAEQVIRGRKPQP